MIKKSGLNMWFYFVLHVFLIMLISYLIMCVIVVISFKLGVFFHVNKNPLIPTLFLLALSIIIGTLISVVVGQKILKPIKQFSESAKEVAKGNFNMTLNEAQPVKEISNLAHSFNIMVQELSSIETLRNDFVVNVSHEFKTPLSTIEGYATLLQDHTLSEEEYLEYTQMIIESTKRLSKLSQNILRLSKLENQEIIIQKTNYRLDEQIREAILLLESQWNAKSLNLEIELDKVMFYGDAELMSQVFINLLENAIKFTPPNGSIHVTLSQTDSNIIAKISDTGIGMTEAVQRHIFEKFYQGDAIRSQQGNGLGLCLVKRILDLSDSSISVYSTLNEGSCFTITLPVH